MTKLFDKAMQVARELPPEVQDEIAHAILSMAHADAEPEVIAEDRRPAVLEGLRQADAGALATKAEVEAARRRHVRRDS